MTTIAEKRIESLKQEIARIQETINERFERIGRGETDMDDCFVSDKMNQLNIQLAKTKIEILEKGGTRMFSCLRDLETDEIVSTKLRHGQYGFYWIIDNDYQDKFGTYVGDAKRESTFTKKGLKRSEYESPVWATTQANGSGMMGAYNSSVTLYPSKKNYALEV